MSSPLGDASNPFGSLGGAGGLQPSTPQPTRKFAPSSPLGAGLVMGVVLALLWVLELVDYGVGHWLDRLGIHALDVEGLPGIVAAPFLHGGFEHLASNSIPLLVLGWLALVGGLGRFVVATLVIVLVSGLFAWLFTSPGTVIIGASGVFERRIVQIVVALGVLVLYGGMIFGVLPGTPGVSWQAHLGGFVGGVGAAWLLGRRARARAKADSPGPAGPTFPRT